VSGHGAMVYLGAVVVVGLGNALVVCLIPSGVGAGAATEAHPQANAGAIWQEAVSTATYEATKPGCHR